MALYDPLILWCNELKSQSKLNTVNKVWSRLGMKITWLMTFLNGMLGNLCIN